MKLLGQVVVSLGGGEVPEGSENEWGLKSYRTVLVVGGLRIHITSEREKK